MVIHMEAIQKNNLVISIIKGILISFIFTVVTLTIFSILLVYTELSEEIIRPVIITITGISILIGSSIGTKKLKKNGLIMGATIGALYILIIYMISSILNSDFSLNMISLIMIGIGLIAGMLGRYNWGKYKIVAKRLNAQIAFNLFCYLKEKKIDIFITM